MDAEPAQRRNVPRVIPFDRSSTKDTENMWAKYTAVQRQIAKYQTQLWELFGISSNVIEVWDLVPYKINTFPPLAQIEHAARNSIIASLQDTLHLHPQSPFYRVSEAIFVNIEAAIRLISAYGSNTDVPNEYRPLISIADGIKNDVDMKTIAKFILFADAMCTFFKLSCGLDLSKRHKAMICLLQSLSIGVVNTRPFNLTITAYCNMASAKFTISHDGPPHTLTNIDLVEDLDFDVDYAALLAVVDLQPDAAFPEAIINEVAESPEVDVEQEEEQQNKNGEEKDEHLKNPISDEVSDSKSNNLDFEKDSNTDAKQTSSKKTGDLVESVENTTAAAKTLDDPPASSKDLKQRSVNKGKATSRESVQVVHKAFKRLPKPRKPADASSTTLVVSDSATTSKPVAGTEDENDKEKPRRVTRKTAKQDKQ